MKRKLVMVMLEFVDSDGRKSVKGYSPSALVSYLRSRREFQEKNSGVDVLWQE